MATGIIMADVDGLTLTDDDKNFLANDALGGVILFKRNVADPTQVRALTDSMRAINPNLIISADQEGGRVARFRDGFTPLPAMGRLGEIYDDNQELALSLAYDTGYLMACEVLAVGVDISFAPVMDIDGCSLVIGDRAFHADPEVVTALSARFIDGMNDAGMKATGKHFPGHGSITPDSHVSDAVDERTLDEIWACDLITFKNNLSKLDALMPAHVIFSQIDDKPAGFSKVWLQDILRQQLGYDGVLFSDDLSMKAAHVAGDVTARVKSAIEAGCDMVLVCNNRDDAMRAVEFAKTMPEVVNRFGKMKSTIPTWQGDLISTCQAFAHYKTAKDNVMKAFFGEVITAKNVKDPTNYSTNSQGFIMHHIFGHTSPDTDAFASAFAFAHWLNAQNIAATPYRLGAPNLETKFVLDYLWQHYSDELDGLTPEILPYLDPNQPLNTLSPGDLVGLTDHNEPAQSITNLADFDVRYIIDHHKLGISTPTPAYVRIYPVGCTCTILYEMFIQNSITITPLLATFMLSAILSDTLNLNSPTTTDDDRMVVTKLLAIANMSESQKDDFAQAMFLAKSDVSHLSARDILLMDYKEYQFGTSKWGIAGIETMNLPQIIGRMNDLITTAQILKQEKQLDHLMIAIVDIAQRTGYAIAYDHAQNTILSKAFGATAQDGLFSLTGIVSRKKQIVPALEAYFN